MWNKIGGSDDFPHAPLGFALAFGCALVWSSYSVMSRLVAAVPSESLALPCFITAVLAFGCSRMFEDWTTPQGAMPWIVLVLLGLGPVGAAFLIWDIGMKRGNVAYLGVLGYASPVISTGLLILLGLASPSWSLVIAIALILIAAKLAAPAHQAHNRRLRPAETRTGVTNWRNGKARYGDGRRRYEPANKGRADPPPSQKPVSGRWSFRQNPGPGSHPTRRPATVGPARRISSADRNRSARCGT